MIRACKARWALVCAILFERIKGFDSSGQEVMPDGLGIDALPVICDDDRRNERAYYQELFGAECIIFVIDLFDSAERRVASNESEALHTLEFMQAVFARALWSYGQVLPPRLDDFTREFDRLDVEAERARLVVYCKARHEAT